MDQYQLFEDYEVMSVSFVVAGLLYSQFGQTFGTYGVLLGFVSALIFHRFGGTYQSYLENKYPELQSTGLDPSSLRSSDHAA